jgi:hypothetical protein
MLDLPDVEINAGDSLSLAVNMLGDVTGRQKLWFTVKDRKSHTDAQSLIRIEETVGLEYINGTAATIAGNGDITVDSAIRGDITVTLKGEETVKLVEIPGKVYYDVKWVDATDDEWTLGRGRALILSDVTREVVI